jgi:hypothetical protein
MRRARDAAHEAAGAHRHESHWLKRAGKPERKLHR